MCNQTHMFPLNSIYIYIVQSLLLCDHLIIINLKVIAEIVIKYIVYSHDKENEIHISTIRIQQASSYLNTWV